jgi:hypothetical protein
MLLTLLPDSPRNVKLEWGLASVCVAIAMAVAVYAAHSGAGAVAAAAFGAMAGVAGFVIVCAALAMFCAACALLVMAYATLAYLCGSAARRFWDTRDYSSALLFSFWRDKSSLLAAHRVCSFARGALLGF